MPANRPNDALRIERERKAWKLRTRGKTYATIAEMLGLSTSGAHKILKRVEERELRRHSANIARFKARQTGQLDVIIEEAYEAWDRSKTPRKRATSRSNAGGDEPGGDKLETLDVIERDGDTSYLYMAMQAMGHQRSLWGLDVAAAQQESVSTISDLVRDLVATGEAHEREIAAEAQARDSGFAGSGAPPDPIEVQDGPQPLQPPDPPTNPAVVASE